MKPTTKVNILYITLLINLMVLVSANNEHGRITPGGPILYISSDIVIPLLTIITTVIYLRKPIITKMQYAITGIMILSFYVYLSFSFQETISYLMEPYSRGKVSW